MNETDTIAAIATPPGDSGIGIIRISGDQAIEIADQLFRDRKGNKILKTAKSHTIHYGFIIGENESEFSKEQCIDEVLISVFRAPKSYTAEDTIEINCHGGMFVIRKVLSFVLEKGARLAQPGEFTKRAFLNGRMDLSEAEAVMDLIHSKSEMARKSSMDQLRGDLSIQIRNLREKILYEIATIESALDDPEHISLEGYSDKLRFKLDEIMKEINALLRSAENGRLVKDGISTVIIGKPNAGKSSLMNLMLGQDKAIVTDIEGTTRDILEESYSLNGIHLNIIDTAGIRDADNPVEKIGVEKAKKYAQKADLILYVIDSSNPFDENDKEILKLIFGKKILFLFNKSDLDQAVREDDLTKLLSELNFDPVHAAENHFVVLHISATDAEHDRNYLDNLENEIEKMFFSGNMKGNDELLITNLRHKEELKRALDALLLVKKSMDDNMPEDFYTIDLMEAYASLGRIIGEEVGDDLIEEIFSKFCMGK